MIKKGETVTILEESNPSDENEPTKLVNLKLLKVNEATPAIIKIKENALSFRVLLKKYPIYVKAKT